MRKQQADKIDLTAYTHLQINFLQAAFGNSLHIDGHQAYLECSPEDKAGTLEQIHHLMEDDPEDDQEGIHLSFSPTEVTSSNVDDKMVRHIMIAVLCRKIAMMRKEVHALKQRLATMSAQQPLKAFSTSHSHASSSTVMHHQPQSSAPPVPSH